MYEDFRQFLGPARDCSICGASANSSTREVWAQDEFFTALECLTCGLVQVDPGLTPEGLNFYYSTYLQHRLDETKKFEQRKEQYVIDAEFLHQCMTTGKILDVGCSGGFFLSVLSDGFKKHGIEIDPEAAKFARSKFDLDVRTATLPDDPFESGSFDLVSFRGVIEHIYDPAAALARATELLRPGGRVFMSATPNLNSLCADVYREKWNLWHPIQHINIFSVETLHSLLGRDRFEIEAVDYPYLGTPYESAAEDYQRVVTDIPELLRDREGFTGKSPPFWGNMMNVIYRLRDENPATPG